jgi:hypothetical protein
MGDVLGLGASFLGDEDRAREDGVGGFLAFAGDGLGAEGRKLPRFIGIGVAAHDTLPARPTGIDDLTQFRIIDECLVGLVDDERRMPLLNRAVECGRADADARQRATDQKSKYAH